MRLRLQPQSGVIFSIPAILRMRASMAMLAVLLMACSSAVFLWLAFEGYASVPAVAIWAAVSTTGLLVMALMVRAGLSARWRDPALAFPQILWAIGSCSVAYVLAGEAKGMVLGLMAVTLLFAALNLRAKQIMAVSVVALVAFATAVATTLVQQPHARVHMELAYGAVLLIVWAGCVLLSLKLYQLRLRLRQQRHELIAALEENRELASRDPLTGLINRRHMLELMHLEQRRCQRGARTMLLAQMDIDHFKSINDSYGHGVGDLALLAFADAVGETIRSTDMLSRWGGEEFVLLLSDTDMAGALVILERVREAVHAVTVPGAPASLRLTVSIGVAQHVVGERVEATLDRADKALYRAKRAGRNVVVPEVWGTELDRPQAQAA